MNFQYGNALESSSYMSSHLAYTLHQPSLQIIFQPLSSSRIGQGHQSLLNTIQCLALLYLPPLLPTPSMPCQPPLTCKTRRSQPSTQTH
uniref:Uncharacterized protein n=1 Tax=Arundo donax TaxID=35708 RepID=A0A0A9CVY8_ARUDO